MEKAVITILGLINPPTNGESAKYYFSKDLKDKFNLKRENYVNMLPLIIDNLCNEYTVECIYTNGSLAAQKRVLEYEQMEFDIENSGVFISEDIYDKSGEEIEESKYPYFLQQYNDIIQQYDSVIIDVSHGFRHFPILATINLIIQNIKNPEKIEYILFAKEIVKFKEYEIIDLREYLDLANISFALSSFNQNYTISNHIKTNNVDYNEFLNELSSFSKHILANSIDALIISTNKKHSISRRLIKTINKILSNDSDVLQNFKPFLLEVKQHIEEIESYKNLKYYERLYKLSKNMLEKGYLLNSITLLSEAVGLYVKDIFKNIDNNIKSFIEEFENKVKNHKNNNKKYNLYILSNQSKTLYKLSNSFNGDYLYIKNPSKTERVFNEKASRVTIRIKNYLLDLENSQDYQDRVQLIQKIDILRNNLAHGNSSERLEEVGKDIENLLKQFNDWIYKKD